MGLEASPHSGTAETADTKPAGMRRNWNDSPRLILAIGGALALAIALRFATQSDLWADEVLSVNIARLPLAQIPEALRHDGAPPLYYFLLHGWIRMFGYGPVSVRALSGVIGIGTFVPVWFAGRRLDERRIRLGTAIEGTRTIAWSALLLFALSPFAIRYSTETRMYALVMLGVVLGYLAMQRALERSTVGRLAVVSLITGLLLLTHYWAFPLLAVTLVAIVVRAVRARPESARAEWRVAAALIVGGLGFLPWLSSFRFQLAHTGTPWGAPVSPFGSWATTFKSFGGNAHLAGWMLVVLVVAGLWARGVDARHIEIDLLTRPGVRWEAGVAIATLGLGLAVARVSGTTFEGRYASVVFPLFLLVGAFGVTVFSDPRVRVGVLVVALALGAWGGGSNMLRNRTQAYQLAPIIKAGGAPGDVVLFCPDAIGTDVVGRLQPGLQTVSFPSFRSPERIDWVDYESKVRKVKPARFADRVLRAAGDQTVWLVYTNNGTLADQRCATVADYLTLARPDRVRELEPDPEFFEHHGLYRYPAT